MKKILVSFLVMISLIAAFQVSVYGAFLFDKKNVSTAIHNLENRMFQRKVAITDHLKDQQEQHLNQIKDKLTELHEDTSNMTAVRVQQYKESYLSAIDALTISLDEPYKQMSKEKSNELSLEIEAEVVDYLSQLLVRNQKSNHSTILE